MPERHATEHLGQSRAHSNLAAMLGKARPPGMVRGVARPPEVRRLEELRLGLNNQLVVVMRKWFEFRLVTFPTHQCRDSDCRVLHSELFWNGLEMLFDAGKPAATWSVHERIGTLNGHAEHCESVASGSKIISSAEKFCGNFATLERD